MASKKAAPQAVSQPGLVRQGLGRSSLRKVLPTLPDADAQLPLPLPITRAIDNNASSRTIPQSISMPTSSAMHTNGSEAGERDAAASSLRSPGPGQYFAPFVREYFLLSELSRLQKQKLPGIYVVPSAKSLLHWFGVISVRQGLYEEGIFRFNLLLPEDFPDGNCPRVFFTPPIFHPSVNPDTGELDVSKGFPKWKRGVHFIWQLLLYIRRAFYKLPRDGNNPAALMYQTDIDAFKDEARQTALASKERLFAPPDTDDPHYIQFSPFDATTHTPMLNCLRQGQPLERSSGTSPGLSWVQNGSLEPFKLPAIQPESDSKMGDS